MEALKESLGKLVKEVSVSFVSEEYIGVVVAARACGRVQEAQVSLVQLKVKPLAVFQISPPSYSYCPCMLTEAAPAVQPLGAQNSKSWTPIFRHVAKRLGTPRRHRSYIFCGVYFLSGSTTVTFAIYIC